MEMLNADTLANAMRHCRDYPQYQVVIAIKDHSRLQEFLISMKEYLGNGNDEEIHSISRAGIIKFKNGSYIRPVMSDSKARGLSANEIIFDESVEDAESVSARIKKVIYHCREEIPETLDDFLGGFRIISVDLASAEE